MKRTGEQISVRLSRSSDEWVRAEAERLGISVGEMVRRVVDGALDDRERPAFGEIGKACLAP